MLERLHSLSSLWGAPWNVCVGCPRLGSLAARSRFVCALLPPLLRSRLPIPLEWASSSRGGASASCSARPHDRTRSARRVRCGAHLRRLLERRRCSVCACCDRVSDGTLGGDHVGDVQPSGAQLEARMSAQECSGALGPVGHRSFDFHRGGVNVYVHSGLWV